MALCTNSTSLFELAFGVNAVYAALSTQLSDTKTRLADVALANFQQIDPSFVVPLNERAVLEDWISKSLGGFKLAHRLRLIPQLLSLALGAIAAITLVQTALWGDKCSINDTGLIVFSTVSLLVAPALYHSFNALLIHLTRAVTASSFTSHEKTKHSLEMYRLCLDAKKTLDETQVLIRKFEKHQAEIAMRDLRSTMSRALHPVRTLRKALQERRVDRMVKSLTRKDDAEF